MQVIRQGVAVLLLHIVASMEAIVGTPPPRALHFGIPIVYRAWVCAGGTVVVLCVAALRSAQHASGVLGRLSVPRRR